MEFKNPFKPGAGHMPPYLAGRHEETGEFEKLLRQDVILQNLVLTGLRGTGKTVLLETFKPLAIREGWLWVGTDLSESASISEESLATRLLTDLSVVTSPIVVGQSMGIAGFRGKPAGERLQLDFAGLLGAYERTPGLVADKLKAVLGLVAQCVSALKRRGIIFTYDEAQNLADHDERQQFPLSLLLDTFQSIQKRDIPFMLLLTGLPTLFPKLVEARTFSERMFRVVFLDRLGRPDSVDAIRKPVAVSRCPVTFSTTTVDQIARISGGYPYFIQFICREVYDVWRQKLGHGRTAEVPVEEIIRKLDSDFFAGRWARATDRQRQLLDIIARLDNHDSEFTVQEIVEKSRSVGRKPFSSSHVNQMLLSLSQAGLVYKNRHGRYSFAVPLLGEFILRQQAR